jgi:hypothetical protein
VRLAVGVGVGPGLLSCAARSRRTPAHLTSHLPALGGLGTLGTAVPTLLAGLGSLLPVQVTGRAVEEAP